MIDVTSLLKDIVSSPLGAPTLPVELEVSENDILNALIMYYKYVPIKSTRQLDFRTVGEATIQMNSVYPSGDNTLFYVGVLGINERMQLGQGRFDEYLLGLSAVPVMRMTPDAQVAINTQIDIAAGDVYYEEDFISGVVRFVVGSSCSIGVVFGYGCTQLDKVPLRHLEVIGHLVGQVYYKRLLAIRGTGRFTNSDFQLDVTLLQKALEEATTEGDKKLQALKYIAMTKG